MHTTRIISIVLFISVILISTLFSFYMNSYREGMDVLENPSKQDVKSMSDILNDTNNETYMKIQKIYDIAKKNNVFFNLYESIASTYVDNVKDYVNKWPILNKNGELVDKNAVSRQNVEKIRKIISDKIPYSEKSFAIRNYICSSPGMCDDKMSKIYNNCEPIWIDIITKYITKLNTSNNENIANTFGAI